jgi:redox-sensitive bicupin YhaK (pirin superfamily)
MSDSTTVQAATRQVVSRTRGRSDGPVTRLMSPGDRGKLLKPFVFLDLVDGHLRPLPGGGLHPHSGIATLTYIAEGSIAFEDTNGSTGLLYAGGVEWMRAGSGVWHGGGPGETGRVRGFQLWVALPPELELGVSQSIYQDARDIPVVGPARVLLGSHEGATSPIPTPSPMTYLAVKLKAGERWRYRPPAGHTVLWIALGAGAVSAPDRLEAGELVVYEPSTQAVEFVAETDAEFMLGSAAPHGHELVLGYYSVHTSPQALNSGEKRILEIRAELASAGRL